MRAVPTAPTALTQIGKPSFIVTALGRRFGINVGATYDMRHSSQSIPSRIKAKAGA